MGNEEPKGDTASDDEDTIDDEEEADEEDGCGTGGGIAGEDEAWAGARPVKAAEADRFAWKVVKAATGENVRSEVELGSRTRDAEATGREAAE